MRITCLTIPKKNAALRKLLEERTKDRKLLATCRKRLAESAESHRITFKAMADRISTLENEISKIKTKQP